MNDYPSPNINIQFLLTGFTYIPFSYGWEKMFKSLEDSSSLMIILFTHKIDMYIYFDHVLITTGKQRLHQGIQLFRGRLSEKKGKHASNNPKR